MSSQDDKQKAVSNAFPVTSMVLPDKTMIEMVYDPEEGKTGLVRWKDGRAETATAFRLAADWRVVPYHPANPLLQRRIILFPRGLGECPDDRALVGMIRSFIHRYVHVSEAFELASAYYVLLTWVYDAFNEIPYLRVRGDYGSGKTRFLHAVGSLCYKPIFASGASTVAPLFHILDQVGGTLILDEGDFRFSDEKADIAKILNNGNAKGFPVLRCEKVNQREFSPRAYTIFGPKVVAARHDYDDLALESRFITEDMGLAGTRDDIPITLPAGFDEESRKLRDTLLAWRFRNRAMPRFPADHAVPGIDKRISQVFAPLLCLAADPEDRARIAGLARDKSDEIRSDRGFQTEADVLSAIKECLGGGDPAISVIARSFAERFGAAYDRRISPKWIGYVVRRKLRLRTRKSNGTYILAEGQEGLLERLFDKYDL